MGSVSKLAGKGKEYEIEGETFFIEPLIMVDHIEEFIYIDIPEKRPKAVKKLVEATIKQADPEATDDDIKKMSMKAFGGFMNAMLEVNGILDGNPGQSPKAQG